MRTIDDELKQLKDDNAQIKADLGVISDGIATLNQTVSDLKTKLAGAGLTADQQAALDSAVTQADDLKAAADALVAGLTPKP